LDESAAANLMKLQPVSFRWKNDPLKLPHLGFIAQDVEKVFPQLVSETDGTKTVEYTGLIAPLVSAVQELSARVTQLEAQLKAKGTP
jgi:Flp pilus assembly pilin Flp